MAFGITISEFLVLNGLIVAILACYILFRRPQLQPSKLVFRNSTNSKGSAQNDASIGNPAKLSGKSNSKQSTYERQPDYKNAPEHSNRQERILNVIFQFNGHDFDAFEVLGVPAGSSFEKIEQAYGELLKSSPEDTREFLQMAFNAIKGKLTHS